jgi:Tol biopolymer transport system component
MCRRSHYGYVARDTGGIEQGVTLSRDGLTIVFSTDRGGGLGRTDLWTATRLNRAGKFSTPVNLGQVNSGAEDGDPKRSNDGRELFFSSSRDGLQRLWRALRSCD